MCRDALLIDSSEELHMLGRVGLVCIIECPHFGGQRHIRVAGCFINPHPN